jgi:uncharacterized membrane protein/predicted DsbA family dithiol-disulfide isomerase
MSPRRLPLFRAVLLVALAGSAALLVDFTHALPIYYQIDSGCFQLSRSGYSFPLGGRAPLPLLGLVGFGVLLGLTLLPPFRLKRALLSGGALLAGLAGLGLLALQAFFLRTSCGLCLLVDLSGVALALLALVLPRFSRALVRESPDPLRPWAWALLGLLAIAAPQLWPTLRPPDPLPPGLQQLQDPRQITVIEFTDFECRACRALHPIFAGVLAEQGEQARLVRIHYPVASHRFARGAARAVLCAEQQGRGEALAAALFEATDLSAVACRTHALSLGVDRGRFDACAAGDEVDSVLKEHAELLRSTGYAVVPTTYVGRERIIGRVGAERLRRAFERARGNAFELSGWSFAGAIAICACALLLLGKRGSPAAQCNPEAS